MAKESALAAVRVLDLTDERGIYGAKLLADLGADVVRVEPSAGAARTRAAREGLAPRKKEALGGDPLRQRGPHHDGASLWHAFFASSRRMVALDLETADGRAKLAALVNDADAVLACAGSFAVEAADLAAAQRKRPQLVVIEASSFGADGPWRDLLAPDLIAGALGGAVATTGDADTPPLKTFGELNFVLSGAYAAIAVLAALYRQRRTGLGDHGTVSVHESIASCLEHVLMWVVYQRHLPNAAGPVLERRGSRHWSNAYEVMAAKGGSIMVTPTPNIDNQLVWLVEQEAQQDLLDPKYQEAPNRGAYIRRFMEVLREWVAARDVEELFFEAQERHSPYGWVLPVDKVAENPQLEARGWWQPYPIGAATVRGPGAPYRFSDTPWRASAAQPAEGFAPRPEPPAPAATGSVADSARPLAGLRILDFTHVLAGPFATRILADLGADVVKVNSATRAGPNAPDGIYYAMWNRNKRALALDMAREESRALCKRLCMAADVVIDNFSVGVLGRWGVGFDDVSPHNPKAIYVQMSGMGDSGPWSKFVTYAPTIHALAGLTHLTGVPGRQDIGIGFSYNDHCAGLHGAVAILAALEARQRTGRGQRIDLSQFEVGVNLAGPTLLRYFASGEADGPCGNRLPHDCAAPHGCYPCTGGSFLRGASPSRSPAEGSDAVADERWVAIACMTDAQWQALKQVMGEPAWAAHDDLATAQGRASSPTLDARIAEWTRGLAAEEVMRRCQARGVPAGVVQTGLDLVEHDPQLRHRSFVRRIDEDHPVLGATYADQLPIRFRDAPCREYRRTRRIGEDNAAVLEEWLGMAVEEVERGEAEGYLA